MRKEIDEKTVADITRLFTMSATDLLDRWFESPVVKGFLAVNGIIGTWAGPDAPGHGVRADAPLGGRHR